MEFYTKKEWSKKQYTGQWGDNPYNRSRVEAGELPAYYIRRRTLMINDGAGTSLITEGVHFLIEGDYSNLPVLHKGNALEGAAYQSAGDGYMFVQRVYRLTEEQAREWGVMYLDRVETSEGDFALPGSDTLQSCH